jgi:hypothetical protein
LIVLNNKTISVKDGGFYSYVVTTPRYGTASDNKAIGSWQKCWPLCRAMV